MPVTASLSFGLGLWPNHPPAEAARLAAIAEAHGFEGIWVPDERFHRDCYLTLGSVARETVRARLGPFVSDPYSRHPALTAMTMATLDELADGRAVLGLGAGASGFAALGIARHLDERIPARLVGLVDQRAPLDHEAVEEVEAQRHLTHE